MKKYYLIAIFLFFILVSLLYYTFTYFRDINDVWIPGFYYVVLFEFQNHIHGSLFLIPIVIIGLIFGLRGAYIVWGLSVAVVIIHVVPFERPISLIVTNVVYLMIPVIIMTLVKLEARLRQQERKIAADKDRMRRDFISNTLFVQEDERKHMARDLHDDTIPRLCFTAMSIQDLSSDINEISLSQLREKLDSVEKNIIDISEDLRRLSLALRPGILDNLGLIPAIRWLADILEKEKGIHTELVADSKDIKLPGESENHIFRIIQEALNNIRQHANATEVKIIVKHAQMKFVMTITDNGVGFVPPRNGAYFDSANQLGLAGIQQRVELLNGTFEIKSAVNKGTTLNIEIPVDNH